MDVPSEDMREAIRGAFEGEDLADVAMMKTEIEWGAQEMQRYRSLRGEWPVRSSSDEDDEFKVHMDSSLAESLRGSIEYDEELSSPIDPQNDYWDYLISIF